MAALIAGLAMLGAAIVWAIRRATHPTDREEPEAPVTEE